MPNLNAICPKGIRRVNFSTNFGVHNIGGPIMIRVLRTADMPLHLVKEPGSIIGPGWVVHFGISGILGDH